MADVDCASLRCAACRHEIALGDAVHTVGGRRFHAACVDAHHAERVSERSAVGVIARYVERFARGGGRPDRRRR